MSVPHFEATISFTCEKHMKKVDWFRAKFPNHPYEHTTDSLKISRETLALIENPAG